MAAARVVDNKYDSAVQTLLLFHWREIILSFIVRSSVGGGGGYRFELDERIYGQIYFSIKFYRPAHSFSPILSSTFTHTHTEAIFIIIIISGGSAVVIEAQASSLLF